MKMGADVKNSRADNGIRHGSVNPAAWRASPRFLRCEEQLYIMTKYAHSHAHHIRSFTRRQD
jgi:hypothetical protein